MTYRRKSDEEIERIRTIQKKKGLSPMAPLWLSLGSALLIFLFISHFPVQFNAPLGFSAKSIRIALASGTGIFAFLFAMQLVIRRNLAGERHNEICRVCLTPNLQGEVRCTCGGEYEPREYYDKVDTPLRHPGESSPKSTE